MERVRLHGPTYGAFDLGARAVEAAAVLAVTHLLAAERPLSRCRFLVTKR